jgi:hypothetical protein
MREVGLTEIRKPDLLGWGVAIMWIVRSASFLLLSVLFCTAPQATAAVPQTCAGCVGSGGSTAVSGGTCSGLVTISVTVTEGKCRWFLGYEDWILRCGQQKGCTPEITRSWSGMPANSALDLCVTIGPDVLCLQPPLSAGGSGEGQDSRNSASVACSDLSSPTYSIGSPSCGISASVTAYCSKCTGN